MKASRTNFKVKSELKAGSTGPKGCYEDHETRVRSGTPLTDSLSDLFDCLEQYK